MTTTDELQLEVIRLRAALYRIVVTKFRHEPAMERVDLLQTMAHDALDASIARIPNPTEGE